MQEETDARGVEEVDGGGSGESTAHTSPSPPVESKLDLRVLVSGGEGMEEGPERALLTHHWLPQ